MATFRVFEVRDFLTSRVVGQEEAIKEFLKGFVEARTLGKERISFFFVGPTGVGKTELTKAIADYFKENFLWNYGRIDLNNFTEQHSISTLLGSPRGYIGSEEGGVLPNILRKSPFTVLHLDEVEKAHPSIYRIFMQLLDEGKVQEVSSGEFVSFKGIAIFTSNLFQETIGKLTEKVKDVSFRELLIREVFSGKFDNARKFVPVEVLERDLTHLSKLGMERGFPPEFVGRIDKIVVFKTLSEKDLVELAKRELSKLGVSTDGVDLLVQKYLAVAREFGVRVFLKKIQEEGLKRKLLSG